MNSHNDPTKSYEERFAEGCLSVSCPTCKATEGERCKTPKGNPAKSFHSGRVEFASRCNRVPVR